MLDTLAHAAHDALVVLDVFRHVQALCKTP